MGERMALGRAVGHSYGGSTLKRRGKVEFSDAFDGWSSEAIRDTQGCLLLWPRVW